MPNNKMLNHKNWILCFGLTLLTSGFSRAPVVSPSQIKDARHWQRGRGQQLFADAMAKSLLLD